MKVLHINWSGNLGGAETLAYELARHQTLQYTPTIAYMNKKLVLGNQVEQEGIRVVEFNMKSGFDIFNFKRYISFIKRERFDIIHDHNGPPLARLSKIWSPHSIFIQHIHGTKLGPKKWENPRVLLWKRVTAKLVDWYIANSQYTKEIAMRKEKIPERLVSIIYNGIDVDKFIGTGVKPAHTVKEELGIKDREWVVGIVGRLTEQKGIDKFIQVAKEVNSRQNGISALPQDAKFVIVGEGELRSELEHLVGIMNLRDKVIFTGAREDIPDVLRAFDVFLLTSNWEPFGIILTEAMASGVPVIAFKVGGVAEVVPEDCGILIPPDINKAVESIIFLRENPEVAKKMIAQAKEWVRGRFSINGTAKGVENIYSCLIK